MKFPAAVVPNLVKYRPGMTQQQAVSQASALTPYSRVLLFDYLEKVNGDEIEIEYNEEMNPTDPTIAAIHTRPDLSAILYVGELPPLERFSTPLVSFNKICGTSKYGESIANTVFGSVFYIRAADHWMILVHDREWYYQTLKPVDMKNIRLSNNQTLFHYAIKYKSLLNRGNIVFAPWCKHPVDVGNSLNVFGGFAHKYDANFVLNEEKIAPVIFHLREVWCGGDERKFDYLIKWLARILQRPQEKATYIYCGRTQRVLFNQTRYVRILNDQSLRRRCLAYSRGC